MYVETLDIYCVNWNCYNLFIKIKIDMAMGGRRMSETQGLKINKRVVDKHRHQVKLRKEKYTRLVHIPSDVIKLLGWQPGDMLELEVVRKTVRIKKAKNVEEIMEEINESK